MADSDGHGKYLKSSKWQSVRKSYVTRTQPTTCRGCGKPWVGDNQTVHHLTYDRCPGNETDSDLLPLCVGCHTAVHQAYIMGGVYAGLVGIKRESLATVTKQVLQVRREAIRSGTLRIDAEQCCVRDGGQRCLNGVHMNLTVCREHGPAAAPKVPRCGSLTKKNVACPNAAVRSGFCLGHQLGSRSVSSAGRQTGLCAGFFHGQPCGNTVQANGLCHLHNPSGKHLQGIARRKESALV